MSLLRAVLRRLATGLVVLWVAATAAYLALLAAPGDTVDSIVGDGADTPQIRAQIIAEWGLDRPAVVPVPRLPPAAGRAATSAAPTCCNARSPRSSASSSRPTLTLAVAAAGLGVLLAVLDGGRHRRPRRRWPRRVSSGVELLLVSTPPFLIGIVLLSVLSFRFGLFPVAGDQGLAALVLPAVTLALPIAGLLAQVLRDGLDRALDEPFVLTARARGVRERTVLLRHALRHALLPAVTLAGWLFGILLGGAVIVEQVFGRPGLGQVTLHRGHQQGHAGGAGRGDPLRRRLRGGQHRRRPGLPARRPASAKELTMTVTLGPPPTAVWRTLADPPAPAVVGGAGHDRDCSPPGRTSSCWSSRRSGPALLAPGDPLAADPLRRAHPAPDAAHWFGTDQLGRDVWTRVVHGAGHSLTIGLAATAIAVTGGVLLGCSPGWPTGSPTRRSAAPSTRCRRSRCCCWPCC